MNTETPTPQSSRERLKELTEEVRPLIDQCRFETVNDALIAVHYRNEEHYTFNTYQGWRKEGKQVRKGEKAFLVWARPKDLLRENDETGKEDHQKFFPVAHIFSNAQVDPLEIHKETEGDSNPAKKHAEELQEIRSKKNDRTRQPER